MKTNIIASDALSVFINPKILKVISPKLQAKLFGLDFGLYISNKGDGGADTFLSFDNALDGKP